MMKNSSSIFIKHKAIPWGGFMLSDKFGIRILLLALMCLISGVNVCLGQYRCDVYQYSTSSNKLGKRVHVALHDSLGKIQATYCNGYAYYLESDAYMNNIAEDGLTQYYYDDSILYKKVITYFDPKSKKPIDSSKTFYYYDSSSNKLIKEVNAKQLSKRVAGQKPGAWRNTIEYNYNENGQLWLKKGCLGEGSSQYLSYDSTGSVLTDSLIAGTGKQKFTIVSKYQYLENGYRVVEWPSDRGAPTITEIEYTLNKNKISRKTIWLPHGSNKWSASNNSNGHKWDKWLLQNPKTMACKEEEKIEYDYENDKLIESRYYYKTKHTTTHKYVYRKTTVDQPTSFNTFAP